MAIRDTNPWTLKKDAKTLAERIVAALVWDLCDRRGIGNEYEGIDPDVRAEMIGKWEQLVAAEIAGEMAPK